MEKQFTVVSKETFKHGRNTLVSFASKPLWKDYEQLRRQEEPLSGYDEKTANYAAKKYGGKGAEVLPLSVAKKELNKYIKDFPNWQ